MPLLTHTKLFFVLFFVVFSFFGPGHRRLSVEGPNDVYKLPQHPLFLGRSYRHHFFLNHYSFFSSIEVQ